MDFITCSPRFTNCPFKHGVRVAAASDEYLSGIRQLDLPLHPFEHKEPQMSFELKNPFAQSWLRDAKAFRRSCEVEFLGECQGGDL